MGYDGCASWFYGAQCLFCDSSASRPGEKKGRPNLNELHTTFSDNIAAWLNHVEPRYFEALSSACKRVFQSRHFTPHCHLLVMAGNLMDMNLAWAYILRLSEIIAKEKPLSEMDSYLNMLPPSDAGYIQHAKGAGYQNLIFNLEVFEEKYFKAICKGKHQLIPYPQFLERMCDAAAIFGAGQVRCGFVLGAQPVEILKKGVEYLADMGIVSDYSIFTPKKGTPWGNRDQPEVLEIAAFSRFLADIYRTYGYKPLYCAMSSRSSIMNECFEAVL